MKMIVNMKINDQVHKKLLNLSYLKYSVPNAILILNFCNCSRDRLSNIDLLIGSKSVDLWQIVRLCK